MNAFRKISLFVLFAFVAVWHSAWLTPSAEAGGCHSTLRLSQRWLSELHAIYRRLYSSQLLTTAVTGPAYRLRQADQLSR